MAGRPELAGAGAEEGSVPGPSLAEACSREVTSQWECGKMWDRTQLLAGSPFFCSQAP